VSRPVFSAEDVRAAARRGELSLAVPAAAIVTPLARDEAARRGIDLIEETVAAGSAPPVASGGVPPPAATCDPDDVERIIERVRARVPGADSAQVREIARRLLERLDR
jgi:hypothetical protein